MSVKSHNHSTKQKNLGHIQEIHSVSSCKIAIVNWVSLYNICFKLKNRYLITLNGFLWDVIAHPCLFNGTSAKRLLKLRHRCAIISCKHAQQSSTQQMLIIPMPVCVVGFGVRQGVGSWSAVSLVYGWSVDGIPDLRTIVWQVSACKLMQCKVFVSSDLCLVIVSDERRRIRNFNGLLTLKRIE